MKNQIENSKTGKRSSMYRNILKALAFIFTVGSSCMLNHQPGPELRFTAFNIQIFGVSKMEKPEVVDVLMKILSRYWKF